MSTEKIYDVLLQLLRDQSELTKRIDLITQFLDRLVDVAETYPHQNSLTVDERRQVIEQSPILDELYMKHVSTVGHGKSLTVKTDSDLILSVPVLNSNASFVESKNFPNLTVRSFYQRVKASNRDSVFTKIFGSIAMPPNFSSIAEVSEDSFQQNSPKKKKNKSGFEKDNYAIALNLRQRNPAMAKAGFYKEPSLIKKMRRD